ncbi:MAG: cyclic nucleotide-binding domain-containing protein [Verrucomicrobia bacterium]|nr:MAG: cyclic nucleotide-binding domain-containing protein [Verrucomicrobiota bacterium]
MMDMPQPKSPARRRAAMTWLVLRESVRAFLANNSLETAATLAYYGFLALVPLLLLLVYFLGVILRSDTVYENMLDFTDNLFPAFSQSVLEDLLKFAQRSTWGLVSIVLLIWSMTPFAGALRSAYQRIFKPERTRHFLLGKLFDLGAVLMLLVIFVVLVAGNAFYSVYRSEFIPAHPALLAALKSVSLFLLAFGVLTLFEKVFAPVRLPLPVLLLGALTVTLLLAAIRPLFDLLLHFNPNYGYAFGSLKAIFLLIVWAYYTFAVMLLGAEIMAAAWRHEALVLRSLFDGNLSRRAADVLLDRFARDLTPGETLFQQNAPGTAMFYVLAGAVELFAGSQKLRVMQPGEYFGEMAMLLEAPRTATAQAGPAGARLAVIDRSNFDTILRENPTVVKALLKEMADRLKATDQKLNNHGG